MLSARFDRQAWPKCRSALGPTFWEESKNRARFIAPRRHVGRQHWREVMAVDKFVGAVCVRSAVQSISLFPANGLGKIHGCAGPTLSGKTVQLGTRCPEKVPLGEDDRFWQIMPTCCQPPRHNITWPGSAFGAQPEIRIGRDDLPWLTRPRVLRARRIGK